MAAARTVSKKRGGTIRSSREIQDLFENATRHASPLLIALIAQTHEERGPEGRVAFVAGKKLGNAVVRNRSKRVMRETARRCGGPWAGADVILIARSGTAGAQSRDLDRELSRLLARAGLSCA